MMAWMEAAPIVRTLPAGDLADIVAAVHWKFRDVMPACSSCSKTERAGRWVWIDAELKEAKRDVRNEVQGLCDCPFTSSSVFSSFSCFSCNAHVLCLLCNHS